MKGLLTLPEAAAWRDQLHAAGRKVVFTSGCFDILHAGHVRYLAQARALGDALIIAMNSDASVRAIKGPQRPVNNESDRAEVLLALSSTDAVVIFADPRTTALIESIRPHIFAKGGDYTVATLDPEERSAMHSCGAAIHILPIVAGRSTTNIITKLATPPQRPPRIAILGSGLGSNYAAIAQAISEGRLNAEIALVISDHADAPILTKARTHGHPTHYLDPGPYRTKLGDAAQVELADQLLAARVDSVVCAGFMRLLKSPVLEAYAGKIVNIHPSLLPAFPGRDAVADALAAGAAESGCTVHLVDAGVDSGRILARRVVPIATGETHATLTEKIHTAEHALYPAVLAAFLAMQTTPQE